ncbi:antitoxin [Streptomyces sp. NPDC005551]|uniref:antitoxin n=1 Tax=unclassified Streptomyces TaxID=2593676 RepID=UPI003410A20C
MGIFDRFKSHTRDKSPDMSDAAEREINKRTGDKYTDQVDKAQQQAEDRMRMHRDNPDRP